MINHARTLLMNVTGSVPMTSYIAEEIVDPRYVALNLPTAMNTVRAVLFGTTPDRHMLNYRCRQLLTLTHATPLEEYLLKLDHRVTYDFGDTTFVDPRVWEPTVSILAGSGTLTLSGDPTPPDGTGQVQYRYLINVNVPGVASVELIGRQVQIVDLDFTPGTKVALPGSGVKMKFSSGSAGQAYTVDVYSRPQKDLSQLATACSNLGEPVYNYLFGISREQPFLTFRELWNRKQELPLRLGALVCALAYRTDELRRA